MQLRNTLSALTASVALASAGPALAATNGNLGTGAGATSQGQSVVTLTIPDLIKISDVNDLTLNYDTGTQQYQASDGVCVYRNGTGNYSITASSGNGTGSFVLNDGSGNTLPYSVSWNGTNLTEGTNDDNGGSFYTGDTTSASCGGGTNATVQAVVSEADAAAAPQATYDDTLSLMVTAE